MTELVAYADLADDPIVGAARAARANPAALPILERALFDQTGGLPRAIAERVLASDGPFARAARAGLADDARIAVATGDLQELGDLAHGIGGLRVTDPGRPPDGPHAPLVEVLLRDFDWGRQARVLAGFYRAHGCGPLAVHRVLRFDGALHGVRNPDPIRLSDLEGRDDLRGALIEDLDAFTSREPVNDALLYGAPGTGKSATVRACAEAFAGHGLRLIQVDREHLEQIDMLFDLVIGDGPSCLVYLDDLVFDDAARADRALRAALEGGVTARPRNVLIWATSNRLNLTHSTHSERADEIDDAEARGEKTALANRFGRRVRFDVRGEEWYLQIVNRLLRERLGTVPPDVEDEALRYARTGAGPTPRTAHHFAAWYRP